MIPLRLPAVAVGLSNLAAAIGIGVTGVYARCRVAVGMVFGVFEAGMPVVGLQICLRFASDLDEAVRWPGAVLLMLVGALGLVRSIRESRRNAAGAQPDPGAADPGAVGPGAAHSRAARLRSILNPSVPGLLASRSPHLGRLLASGLVLSMDNLVVGFALGTYGVSVAVGAILIGSISVGMSLVGLEVGGVLGRWAGRRSEQVSGLILILVGAAIAGGALG